MALSAREIAAALGDRRLETIGQFPHEVVCLGDGEGCPDVVVGGGRVSVADIARDRAGEQVGLLRHVSEVGEEFVLIPAADVQAVDEDGAGRDVEESGDE
ncbi:hypothetical protein GCM10020255_059030 [Rhodococcus baikonurensis]